MRNRLLGLMAALGAILVCCTSCSNDVSSSERPGQEQGTVPLGVDLVQELGWRGQGNGFLEWGQTREGFFGESGDAHQGILEIWAWRGPTLDKERCVNVGKVLDIRVLPGGRFLANTDPGNTTDDWPVDIRSFDPPQLIKRWEPEADSHWENTGSSKNGVFAALMMEPDLDVRDTERYPICLIDISTLDRRWVGELSGRGINTVRQIVVSDNGEYIAIGGWRNGIALVSTSLQKVLWNMRSPGEISTGYVVFSSEGSSLYAGGSAGCVFELETKTGNVKRQWFASQTGKSVYGHRISWLAISPDDAWVAAGTGPEGEVYLFNLKSDEKPRMLLHGGGTILLVSFSPDSERLATVGGGVIKVWSIKRSGQSVLVHR
jgi:WD40 repeat protein